jgi:hypothetical protein
MTDTINEGREERTMTTKTIDLADLGITKEDLVDRLVGSLTERLLSEQGIRVQSTIPDAEDDDEPEMVTFSPLGQALHGRVERAIAEAVDKVAARHVIDNLEEHLAGLDMTPTNRWGERQAEKMTLREWIDQRIDGWLRERVDYNGRSKREGSGGGADTPRVVYLIDQHLKHAIGSKIEAALKRLNTEVGESFAAVVKEQGGKRADKLTVKVS